MLYTGYTNVPRAGLYKLAGRGSDTHDKNQLCFRFRNWTWALPFSLCVCLRNGLYVCVSYARHFAVLNFHFQSISYNDLRVPLFS